jgi:hypothetical protein
MSDDLYKRDADGLMQLNPEAFEATRAVWDAENAAAREITKILNGLPTRESARKMLAGLAGIAIDDDVFKFAGVAAVDDDYLRAFQNFVALIGDQMRDVLGFDPSEC